MKKIMTTMFVCFFVGSLAGGCKKQASVSQSDMLVSAKPPARLVTKKNPTNNSLALTPKQMKWPSYRLDSGVERSKDGGIHPNLGTKSVVDAGGAGEGKLKRIENPNEKAVDNALKGVLPALKRCHDVAGASSNKMNIRLRVHRLGYVIWADVTGVEGRIKECVNGALKNVKITGIEDPNGITTSRTFEFSAGREK